MNPKHITSYVAAGLGVALALALAGPLRAQQSNTGPGLGSGSGAGTGTGSSAGAGLGATGTGFEAGSGLGTTGTGTESGIGPRANIRGRDPRTVPGIPGTGGGRGRLGQATEGGGPDSPTRRTAPADAVDRGGGTTGGTPGRAAPGAGPDPRYGGTTAPGGAFAPPPANSPTRPGTRFTDPGAGGGIDLPTDSMPPLEATRNPFETGDLLEEMTPEEITEVTGRLHAQAQRISEPGERALALVQIARTEIFINRLREAHESLGLANAAALQEPSDRIRDLRLLAIVTETLALAEKEVAEAMVDETMREEMDVLAPERRQFRRTAWIRLAAEEWEAAAASAQRIAAPGFRSQMLYQVAASQSGGSRAVAEPLRRVSYERSDLRDQAEALRDAADRGLVRAAAHAWQIERPVWRDRALQQVATDAALSGQFSRGSSVARTIPNPEVRGDTLVKIADTQARLGLNQDATVTYAEAARAVAAIASPDPRAILAGVLIDSLVAVGRFEDARASVVLYPDLSRQVLALGAIAESQGSRGLAPAARDWIVREAPPRYRSELLRRVTDGILASVEKNRVRNFPAPMPFGPEAEAGGGGLPGGSGPGVSTGSGPGFGTGAEAGTGVGTTGTGSEAGTGTGTTGTGAEAGPGPR